MRPFAKDGAAVGYTETAGNSQQPFMALTPAALDSNNLRTNNAICIIYF